MCCVVSTHDSLILPPSISTYPCFVHFPDGAALFYQSAAGSLVATAGGAVAGARSTSAAPTPVLQQYIWHRLFAAPFSHAPRFYIADASDDENQAILVPAGADSEALIDSTSSAPRPASTSSDALRRRGRALVDALVPPSESNGSPPPASALATDTGGRILLTDLVPMHSVFLPPTAPVRLLNLVVHFLGIVCVCGGDPYAPHVACAAIPPDHLWRRRGARRRRSGVSARTKISH